MKPKTLAIALGVIAVLAIGFLFFRLPQPIIELRPERLFSLGGFTVTNTIFTAWVMILLIALITILGTRKLSIVPSGFQNLFEAVIEGFGNIVNGVAGERNGRRFFPVVFAFFLYIVFSNWMALTPVFNVIGLAEDLREPLEVEARDNPEAVLAATKFDGWIMNRSSGLTLVPLFTSTKFLEITVNEGTAEQQLAQIEQALEAQHFDTERQVYGIIAPFLRGVNTDVNSPLSYALWSAIFVEFWGITTLGLFGYGSKFFNFKRLLKGDLMNGLIDVFVGLLELISEFARLISFTFRLFGNIFAGEVLLFMMSFLVPFVLVDVFYALELFVGLIQGFVFAMLTLVFGVMAVSGHGDHEESHGAAGREATAHGAAHA